MLLRTRLLEKLDRGHVLLSKPLVGTGRVVGHTETVFWGLLTIFAAYMAFTCNQRSGAHNPYFMAIVAGLFPELYLLQSNSRSIMGTYRCRKP